MLIIGIRIVPPNVEAADSVDRFRFRFRILVHSAGARLDQAAKTKRQRLSHTGRTLSIVAPKFTPRNLEGNTCLFLSKRNFRRRFKLKRKKVSRHRKIG